MSITHDTIITIANQTTGTIVVTFPPMPVVPRFDLEDHWQYTNAIATNKLAIMESQKPSKSFMNEPPIRTEFIIVLFLLSFALSMIYSAVTRKS